MSLAAVVLCGASAAACSLPYQQLSLPDTVTPGQQGSAGHAGRKSGVALSNPAAEATRESRKYPGSGDLVGEPQKASAVDQQPGGASSGHVSIAPAAGGGKDMITLSVAGASVPEVAKTVLGDMLKVNYSVSDKVKAVISLHTAQPVDKNDLLAIFETVLRAEGVAMVVENGFYRIVPASEVANSGVPFRPMRRAGPGPGAGVASSIVPLHYVSAVEIERILKSAAPQAAILRVDGPRNLLMISGTPQEQNSLRDIISVFDVDWMRGMSFAIFPVETLDPEAIAQELDTVFASKEDGPMKGMIRFVPNRRLKSILVITSRAEYLRKAETWLKRIDLASKATEKQVHIYKAQHRPATELAPLLQKVYQAQAGSSSVTSSSSKPSSSLFGSDSAAGGASAASIAPIGGPQPFGSAGMSSAGTGLSQATKTASPFGTGSTAPAGTKPSDAAAAGVSPDGLTTGSLETPKSTAAGGLPPDDRSSGISVVADESRNSLVITATPPEYRRVRELLARLDVSAAQILLEATIAEVTLGNNLKFGVRWFLNKGGNNPTFNSPLGSGSDSVAPLPIPLPTAAAGFQYILNATNFQIVLNALSAVTDVNVVSSPSLMVQENKKAQLQIGDQVPIITQEAQSVIAGAPVINSVTLRDTGVILSITPWLADDGKIVLEIEQEVSDAVTTTTSKIDSPTIQQRRVKTTVTVNAGQTIVLAGFMQDRATRNRDQVPLLGNIPVIGNAFKSKDDTIRRTELLISITPQVVRDSRLLDDVTAEYRDRLNFSTRPQRKAPPDQREELDRILR